MWRSTLTFEVETTPATRLVCAAGALLAGECLGFALGSLSDAWAWVGGVGLTAFLAAYGWGVRRLGFAALLTLGAVLALRTDAGLRTLLDANAGLNGPRPPLDVRVEGVVDRWKSAKTGGWSVAFQTHAGPMQLKVVAPVARGGRVPQVGETWRVNGWISRKEDRGNRYARRTLWVPESVRARRVEAARPDAARARWAALGEALAHGAGLGLAWCPELAGLNRAILLGRRGELSRTRKQLFVDAGTIHVFAISGLHVMVVAWGLCAALRRLGVSARYVGLLGVPLVWAYVVLTGMRPSAVRAATMATLMQLAPALGRRTDPLAAWSVTALGVYGLSPARLFDLGCALSFTVMFGIVLWDRWVRKFRPWFAEGSRLRRLAGDFGVSFAAWVAGVPIAAHAFGRFTPGGLLANLAVLYCVKRMVKLGAGALVAGVFCLPLAALLNNAAAACTWGMAFVSERVAALPFSSFKVEPWSFVQCAAWYLGWAAALMVAEAVLPRRRVVARRWW